MKLVSTVFFYLALSFSLLYSQAANHVVISEVGPMGGASTAFNTGEFIELYNPLPTNVTFGANVQIVSGNTSGTNAAEWSVSLNGKTIKAYGFLLIGDGGVAGADVAFPSSKNLANSGIRSCVQLRDGSTVIDAFAWDTGTTLLGEGTRFTASSVTSDGKTFERKSGPTAVAHTTQGNAWDSDNNANDFFENTSAQANPQNSNSPIAVHPYAVGPTGSGSASVSPARWKYSTPSTLTFTLKPTTDTLRGYRFRKPAQFTWSNSNITIVPSNAVTTQLVDTTTITNITLKGSDSLVVTITGVTAVDTTDDFTFDFRASKDGSTYLAIQTQPKMLVYGSPRPMSTVKAKDQNGVHKLLTKWAVVKGVVTVGNEFGGPSYLQDATAGIAVFDSSVSNNVARGDEIVVLGIVAPFNDLFELTPAILLEKLSEGNSVDTLVLTALQINSQGASEPYESRLIRIDNITNVTTTGGTPATAWNATGSGTNYNLTDATGQVQTRISPRVNLANLPTPTSKFDMVGVLGQFLTNYQVLPRFVDDIILEGAGPRILSQAPYESNITTTSLRFTWQTDVPSSSTVRYGKTTSYGLEKTDTNKVTQHAVTVTGLSPGTIYNVQLVSVNSGGTTSTSNYIASTSSKTSTGAINVYFSKSVNTALARGEIAQTVGLLSKLLNRIDSAKYSIDCALYSLSGNVGANIASRLITAKNRGVKVRVIGEKDNQSTAPWTTLKNGGITVIDDGFDATNAGAGLHHNKFFVFDSRDTTSDTDDWVMTGSWNPTDPGTDNDMQNVIEIQDQALAGAYTTEFSEMWGSSTETPSASASRFGGRKLDNTPHLFVIGGVPIESYFSPSDKVTSQILKTVNKGQHSLNVAMLTLTRSDISAALRAKRDAGLKVRGVLDNGTDQGSQYNFFISNTMDFWIDKNSAFLHHKYLIVDAELNNATQYVLTGSHNWSSAAENSNNENTLIIQSNRIANLYLQEFAARYKESGGADNIVVSVERLGTSVPSEFSLSQNYPNPFNPSTNIEFTIANFGFVSLKVYDMLGRNVATLVNEVKAPGVYRATWQPEGLSSGVYFYELRAGSFRRSRTMLFVK